MTSDSKKPVSKGRTGRIGTFLAVLILLLVVGSPALAAGTLAKLTVSPNPAAPGQDVDVVVTTGGKKCGYKLDLEYEMIGPEANKGSKSFEARYSQPGAYDIRVSGSATGAYNPCKDRKTVRLVVEEPAAIEPPPEPAAASSPEESKEDGRDGNDPTP